ncbi:MAG: FkbM family methyltransferase [Candidatus Acidiferrales bacterium]|jgi:FkbM family methyltransferase
MTLPTRNQEPSVVSRALAMLPAFRGNGRLADALARVAARRDDGWTICSPGNGVVLRVNLRDRIERLMWGHVYEPHVQRCLAALLSPGDVYVDVGAHIGYHAVWASSLVGPTGKVFAFEADPANFARLSENLRAFPGSAAINKAVWSSSEAVTFERSSQSGESGWGTLTAVRDLKAGEHIEACSVSLDDWSAEHQIDRLTLIKIDAEGSEVGILKGADTLIEKLRPAIISEVNAVVLKQAGSSSAVLLAILERHRYSLFEFEGMRLEAFPGSREPKSPEVLALPVEQLEELRPRLQRSGFRI